LPFVHCSIIACGFDKRERWQRQGRRCARGKKVQQRTLAVKDKLPQKKAQQDTLAVTTSTKIRKTSADAGDK
jgi:hypothetical protein